MRIDKFLKNSRIIKRRTIAKEAADSGRITINGKVAKAGSEVRPGDRVHIAFGTNPFDLEVLSVPEAVRKEDAQSMYRILEGHNE
ncbi:MAG: RNA-binding S4 domain-containing protein [Peptoniphilaceae bacterium]|nr:RNA-binding S4 domain-containing protein [Peptoniphilaceae bacterium]MDY5766174.1 RNA-binding S4 domain-containing protein [Peptoniphilaceae bacterium]